MSQLKSRIKTLLDSTINDTVKELCNEAMDEFKEYSHLSLNSNQMYNLDEHISTKLIEKLSSFSEENVKSFIEIEKRIIELNNLGVKNAINVLTEMQSVEAPALYYVLENLNKLAMYPEWKVANNAIEILNSYSFEPKIKRAINIIEENLKNHSEEISLYEAIDIIKNTDVMISKTIEPMVESYLNNRTSSSRSNLLNELSKFSFSPNVGMLYRLVAESSEKFQIKDTYTDANIHSVYSPVIMMDGYDIFSVYGKFYKKVNEEITVLDENEVQQIPTNIVELSNLLIQDNIKIGNDLIAIYAQNSKFEIYENENNILELKIDGKIIPIETYQKMYLGAIYKVDEMQTAKSIFNIVENWNIIFELDFVKSLSSKIVEGLRADVFRCGDRIYINKVNNMMSENSFVECNAMQSRNLVFEFLNYDLGNTFSDLLPQDIRIVKEYEEEKEEYMTAIKHLESKREELQLSDFSNDKKIKEIIEAITEEINKLKSEYYSIQEKIESHSTVSETISELSYSKKS